MLGTMLRENPREIYSMQLVGDCFVFQLRDTLYKQIIDCQKESDDKAPRVDVQTLEVEAAALDGVVSLRIPLPVITLPNLSHKKLDWKLLGECAEKIQTILWYVNAALMAKEIPLDLFLSEDLQLMAIETGYNEGHLFHGCPISVGFNPEISEKLTKKYPSGMKMSECQNVALDFYLRLSTHTHRDRESTRKLFGFRTHFTSLNVSVREEGVPHFVVPGNCACLGANPDEFKYDRDMYSHNLDTAVQQITMLVSLSCFWNNVLKPLSKEK